MCVQTELAGPTHSLEDDVLTEKRLDPAGTCNSDRKLVLSTCEGLLQQGSKTLLCRHLVQHH